MKVRLGRVITFIFLLIMLTGCTGKKEEEKKIQIAYQYGLAYAPVILIQDQQLIEKAYEEATGMKVAIVWTQMNSGADINTGIASGDIQVGFMGTAPAITGIVNHVGYKIFTNLSGQEHGLMTNREEITTFEDLIQSEHQVALVNIGSIQHIILAKALARAGYDAHALDANLVAMKHPDGMSALLTGSIACHLTTNPYLYREKEDSTLHEIEGIDEVWTKENSFIVGIASNELYQQEPELYTALCSAVEEAVNLIHTDLEKAAEITHSYNGNDLEDEIMYLKKGSYSIETVGIFELSQFMAEAGFINQKLDRYEELVFGNVKGN